VNPLIEAQLPDVECGCDLIARQAKVDAEAALYAVKGDKLWHTPACSVNIRIELRKVLEQIEAVRDVPVLPDPVLERLHAEQVAELEQRRDSLASRLGMGAPRSTPERWVTGYDQATGQARLGPRQQEHTQ